MKKKDLGLIFVAILLLCSILGFSWLIFIKVIAGLFMFLFVLYWKIIPYKMQLSINNQRLFGYFEKIFCILVNNLNFIPNIQLGQNIQIGSSYVAVIAVLIIILIVL